jgi:hypothetical protein
MRSNPRTRVPVHTMWPEQRTWAGCQQTWAKAGVQNSVLNPAGPIQHATFTSLIDPVLDLVLAITTPLD